MPMPPAATPLAPPPNSSQPYRLGCTTDLTHWQSSSSVIASGRTRAFGCVRLRRARGDLRVCKRYCRGSHECRPTTLPSPAHGSHVRSGHTLPVVSFVSITGSTTRMHVFTGMRLCGGTQHWTPTRLRCRQPEPFQDVVVSEGSYLVVQHNLLHAKGNTPNVLLSGSVRHRLFARARLGRSRVHTFSEFEQPGLHPGAD